MIAITHFRILIKERERIMIKMRICTLVLFILAFLPIFSQATQSEIARDGTFIAFPSGVVRDTKAGLEWVAGPDRDVTWDEARDWVERLNIDGGGWRMPTMDELGTLYQPGRGKRNMTPLLKTTGWLVWSGEKKALSSRLFSFNIGCKKWPLRNASCFPRAFAVRLVRFK
jgi:hypothetical protein